MSAAILQQVAVATGGFEAGFEAGKFGIVFLARHLFGKDERAHGSIF